ncbi:vitellogenin-like [Arapaima gigas]
MKCYSTEAVLQCFAECSPVRTTPVTVAFHCIPIDSNVSILSSIREKREDIRETIDAHVTCDCTEQCA